MAEARGASAEPMVFEGSGGVWSALRVQAMQAAAEEPLLASYLHATILHHDRIEEALSYHLAQKLGGGDMSPLQLRETTMAPDTRRLVQLTVEARDGADQVLDMLLAKKRAADRREWLETKGNLATIE